MTMKIVFKTDSLVKVLKELNKVVPTSTTRHYLKFLLISADMDDCRVDFYASSEEQSMRRTVFEAVADSDVQIVESGSCLVNAKDILEIAKKASGDITIEAKEVVSEASNAHRLGISFGKVNYELSGLPVETYAMYKADDSQTQSITISAPALRTLIKQTQFATSKNETRPILTGIHLSAKENGELSATATDGLRLSQLTVPAKVSGACDITIKGAALGTLADMLPTDDDEEITLHLAGNALLATWDDEGTRLVIRALEGTYPDVTKIIPQQVQSWVKVNRVQLLETCERVSVMVDSESNRIPVLKFEFQDGTVKVSTQTSKGDKAVDIVPIVDGESKTPVIFYNSRFWTDFLKSVETENVRIGLNGANQPSLTLPDGAKGLALLSPIMHRQDAATTQQETAQSA